MNDLADAIVTLVDSRIQQNETLPEICFIGKIYEDNYHVDVKLTDGYSISYVPCFANNLAVDNIALLIRTRNGQKIVISR